MDRTNFTQAEGRLGWNTYGVYGTSTNAAANTLEAIYGVKALFTAGHCILPDTELSFMEKLRRLRFQDSDGGRLWFILSK